MPQLERVLEKYPKDVRIALKNFPLQNHKMAHPAALAALAAGEQGKYWEYHDLIMANYNKLDEKKFVKFAEDLKLDMAKFEKDRKDPKLSQAIAKDQRDGRNAGVRGTPTLFVNGLRLSDRSDAGFDAAIEAALKEVKK